MPFFFKETIDDKLTLSVWKIRETSPTEFETLELSKEEKEKLQRFKTNKRKVEWLAIRALLLKTTGQSHQIAYRESGQPYIKNASSYISISHTKGIAAITLSKKMVKGVDVQTITTKVERISHKFVNEEEEKWVNTFPLARKEILTLIWTAKEALYKSFEEVVDFEKDLTVLPPDELDNKGMLHVQSPKTTGTTPNTLVYTRLEDCYLTYLIE